MGLPSVPSVPMSPHSRPGKVLCEDRARHALLSIRLHRNYFAYLFVCFVLSAVVCTSTFGRLVRLKHEGRAISSYERQPWETLLEVLIGLAVCTETLSTLWLTGRAAFLRDSWCIFDATVVVLTLLDWLFRVLRWALLEEEVLRVDLPLLAMRFVLQPCRVLAAVSMVRRVHQMQQGIVDVAFNVLEGTSCPELERPEVRIMTKELKAEICEHLPTWCRFRDWHLSYTPHVHGTSMQTFLRGQVGGGPNVIVLRDASGNVLGGFTPEAWRACAEGDYDYGTGDSFVFTSCPAKACEEGAEPEHEEEGADLLQRGHGRVGSFRLASPCQEITFFQAKGEPCEVLQWADRASFSLSGAISIRDDFRLGSTAPCPAFGSPALVHGSPDFVIAEFECWQIA